MDLSVELHRRGDRTSAIYRALVEAMGDGRLRSGDRFPSTRKLAADLAVSRTTVETAYQRLGAEGYLQGRVGAGTFVTAAAVAEPDKRDQHRRGGALRPRVGWVFAPDPTSSRDDSPGADFRVGIPDPALFPFDTWRRLVSAELRLRANLPGTYGEPSGHPALREAIAGQLGRSRSLRAVADDILITNGTQQALDLTARVLLAPGNLVAVEEPGYSRARALLASHGATVVGVPVDAEGIVVQRIPAGARLVFSTPSHQFPLGIPMSLERRRELLRWADEHDSAIFEDDYDSEFRFTARPLAPLHSLDRSGRVLYAGTFSKSLLPSLRIGFLIAPSSLRSALRAARQLTDWHGVMALQAALARFIDDGSLATHVRRASAVYQQRRTLMLGGIGEHLGEWFDIVPSSAGLHVCAILRQGMDLRSTEVVAAARMTGTALEGLATHYAGPADRQGLVLGYGMAQPQSIGPGLAGVARLVRRFLTPAATQP